MAKGRNAKKQKVDYLYSAISLFEYFLTFMSTAIPTKILNCLHHNRILLFLYLGKIIWYANGCPML